MSAITPGVVYTVTDQASGNAVAQVRIDNAGADSMVRWNDEGEFSPDPDGLAMLLFPSEFGVTISS